MAGERLEDLRQNMKGALACYYLKRGHDETGQRAGLRRHGEPLGGLLCVDRYGGRCIYPALAPRTHESAPWGSLLSDVAAGTETQARNRLLRSDCCCSGGLPPLGFEGRHGDACVSGWRQP